MEICKCGCGIEFCVCKELEEKLKEERESAAAKDVRDCCNYCGCKIAYCQCNAKLTKLFEKDRCRCKTVLLEEENEEGEAVQCTCGCELGFCICQKLKPCKCYQEDDKLDFSCLEERKTDHEKKRDKYLKYLEIPTISEAENELGDKLSSMVLVEINDVLKEALGLIPCLEGVEPPLWVSPSDLLIEKVALKPPLTQKYIQALTHEGILELGREIEEKVMRQKEKEKMDALEEQEMNLRKIYEIREARLVARIKQEEYEKRMQEIEKLSIAFEKKIKKIICSVQVLIQSYDRQLKVQSEWWRRKLREEVGLATKQIAQHFLDKLRKQEDILVSIFKEEISRLEKKKNQQINLEGKKWQAKLDQLKHSLECKNIANLMFVLCKERRRCQLEKHTLETNYREKITALEKNANANNSKMDELELKKTQLEITLKVRENFLIEILKQFQKFIYFALRATPTQAEFLLSIERIMNDFLEEPTFDKAFEQDETEVDVVDITVDELEDDDIVEELESLICETIKETDALPSFTYKDKLYIRQDYRNILSQKPIVRGDKYWNQDVEELIEILEKVAKAEKKCKCGCELGFCICHEFNTENIVVPEELKTCKCGCGIEHCICEQFSLKELSKEHIKQEADKTKNPESSKMGVKKVEKDNDKKQKFSGSMTSLKTASHTTVNQITTPKAEKREQRKSLLATADSVEMLRQSFSTKVGMEKPINIPKKETEEKSTKEETESNVSSRKLSSVRDSIILRMANLRLESLTKMLESQKKQKLASSKTETPVIKSTSNTPPIQETPSKLLQVSDSIEIAKSRSLVMPKRESLRHLQESQFRIAGDPKGTEHLKTYEDFTKERANSLINLLKDDRNLLRLFTACLR